MSVVEPSSALRKVSSVNGNRFAAHFVFALDDDFHIQRQLTVVRLHQRFKSLNLHPELAFIVHRAAGIDIVVALGGLKWWRDPLIQRIGWLHIVMRVTENGR